MKFEELYAINVNDKVEKKKTGSVELNYLSWPFAVAEMTKAYPDWKYEIKMFDNKPYLYDENLGYMVFTSITAENITHEMWLPVMDGANKSMKDKVYTYDTRFGSKTVEAATMFDINKTIMRCLVKNIAMFGLGLYIYAGEDLPEENIENIAQEKQVKNEIKKVTEEEIKQYIIEKKYMNVSSLSVFNYLEKKNWKDKNGNLIDFKQAIDFFEEDNKKKKVNNENK